MTELSRVDLAFSYISDRHLFTVMLSSFGQWLWSSPTTRFRKTYYIIVPLQFNEDNLFIASLSHFFFIFSILII